LEVLQDEVQVGCDVQGRRVRDVTHPGVIQETLGPIVHEGQLHQGPHAHGFLLCPLHIAIDGHDLMAFLLEVEGRGKSQVAVSTQYQDSHFFSFAALR
jgi:hypothetical protein